MTESDWIILISIVVGIAILTPVIVYSIKEGRKAEQIRRKQIEEEYAKEPEYEFVKARVLTKKASSYYASFRQPKRIDECKVVFLTETGEEKEFFVSKEFYQSIEENQEGTLVTVNGNFFDFGDGQEIEETEQEMEPTMDGETSL